MEREPVPFWQDRKKRGLLFQAFGALLLLGLGWILVSNTASSLEKQGVAAGFGFLWEEAAFHITDTPLGYSPEDSFAHALAVGLVNTLLVAFIGNFFAILLGTLLGLALLSSHWMLATGARIFVDTLRNIPLLLQLFFWYALITETFPPVREAMEILPWVFFSQRGLVFPAPVSSPLYMAMGLATILGFVALGLLWYRHKKKREEFGEGRLPYFPLSLSLPFLPPLFLWAFGGFPINFHVPVLQGLNFQGGVSVSPEFFALLAGLTFYTSTFIAEIVRSGIQSVSKGQWEAARSLGLSSGGVLGLVIFPQALRVIIPPLTSQMLNLTKNSSLAVAIGYPDLVNVANTTSNQTGQAVECIAIIMAIYLSLSLLTSLLMNWYNHRTRLITK